MILLNVVVILMIVGVLLWAINAYVPMQGTIKKILNAVVVVCVLVWLLSVFGSWGGWNHFHVPRLG